MSTTPPHRWVVLDTEYTAWEGSMARGWSEAWESREIVQIGAISTTFGDWPELSTLDLVVKPTRNPQLSKYFVELTGITQERVDRDGISLPEALQRLERFASRAHVVCWGRDDLPIREHLEILGLDSDRTPAMSDVRAYFESAGIDVRGVSSGQIGGRLGGPPIRRAHDAVEDCRSVLEGLRRLPPVAFARAFEA